MNNSKISVNIILLVICMIFVSSCGKTHKTKYQKEDPNRQRKIAVLIGEIRIFIGDSDVVQIGYAQSYNGLFTTNVPYQDFKKSMAIKGIQVDEIQMTNKAAVDAVLADDDYTGFIWVGHGSADANGPSGLVESRVKTQDDVNIYAGDFHTVMENRKYTLDFLWMISCGSSNIQKFNNPNRPDEYEEDIKRGFNSGVLKPGIIREGGYIVGYISFFALYDQAREVFKPDSLEMVKILKAIGSE